MVAPRSARHLTWPAARPTFRLQVGAGHADTDNGDGRREAAPARIPRRGKMQQPVTKSRQAPDNSGAYPIYPLFPPQYPECGWSHTGFRGTVLVKNNACLCYPMHGGALPHSVLVEDLAEHRLRGFGSVPPAPGRHVGHGVRWAAGRCGLDGTRRRQGGRRGSRCRSAPGRWRPARIPGYLHGRRAWAWSRGPGTGSLGR